MIFVNDKFYVYTCLHALYDEFMHAFSGNIAILLNNRGNIKIGREIFIFNTSAIDALIEVFPTSKQKEYAFKVSDQSSSIGFFSLFFVFYFFFVVFFHLLIAHIARCARKFRNALSLFFTKSITTQELTARCLYKFSLTH